MHTLYFVRHGETDYNRQGIVQGSGIDSSINSTGIQQAKAFFQAYQQEHFDHLFISELKRTRQTLQPWASAGHALTTTSALNELSWGTHEGIKPTAVQKQEFDQILKRWQAGHLSERIAQGESPLDAWDRAQAFFERLLVQPSPSTILLCSHGRQLRVILSMLLGKGLHDMEPYRHGNTGLSIVRIQHIGQGELISLNDARHLASLSHLP